METAAKAVLLQATRQMSRVMKMAKRTMMGSQRERKATSSLKMMEMMTMR